MIEHSVGPDLPRPDPLATKAAAILAVIDAELSGVFADLDDRTHARLESRVITVLREPEEPRIELGESQIPTRDRFVLPDPDAAYPLHLPRRGGNVDG